MGFTHSTLRQQSESEANMVTLKQRTYRTKGGVAVGHGDTRAAFLVGPEGGKVSDETAVSLGLIDGGLPEDASVEQLEYFEGRGRGGDKTGRRSAGQGRPLSVPKKKKDAEKSTDKSEDKAAGKSANKGFGKGKDKEAVKEAAGDALDALADDPSAGTVAGAKEEDADDTAPKEWGSNRTIN